MKNLTRSFTVYLIVGLAAILMVAGPASAEWMLTHGHSGHIENLKSVASSTVCTFQGLQFIQNYTSVNNRVHFAVPTKWSPSAINLPLPWRARYLSVKFFTGSIEAVVFRIHVMNGGSLVKTFEGPWKDGWFTLNLDLGRGYLFPYAMGVTFEINIAGVENLSHRFAFQYVGANFYQGSF